LASAAFVATHAVYLSEMSSQPVRNKMLLTSQASTALVGFVILMTAHYMMPTYWKEFVWLGVAVQALVLLPLLYFRLPESPRGSMRTTVARKPMACSSKSSNAAKRSPGRCRRRTSPVRRPSRVSGRACRKSSPIPIIAGAAS